MLNTEPHPRAENGERGWFGKELLLNETGQIAVGEGEHEKPVRTGDIIPCEVVKIDGATVTDVARRNGVSRQAVHEWLRKWQRQALVRSVLDSPSGSNTDLWAFDHPLRWA